jgi:hypothetical protein
MYHCLCGVHSRWRSGASDPRYPAPHNFLGHISWALARFAANCFSEVVLGLDSGLDDSGKILPS